MPVADVSDRSLSALLSLDGRNAVVTGGARGIGLAIAKRFAEAGADLAIGDLDKKAAEAAAESIAADFGRRHTFGSDLDVSDSISVAALADRAMRELGGIDVWVNNAVMPQGRRSRR